MLVVSVSRCYKPLFCAYHCCMCQCGIQHVYSKRCKCVVLKGRQSGEQTRPDPTQCWVGSSLQGRVGSVVAVRWTLCCWNPIFGLCRRLSLIVSNRAVNDRIYGDRFRPCKSQVGLGRVETSVFDGHRETFQVSEKLKHKCAKYRP